MMIFPAVALVLGAGVTGCSPNQGQHQAVDFDAQAFGMVAGRSVVWVADILKSKHYVK